MKLPIQSIRWRIQAWHGLILLIAIGAFCLTAYQLAWFNQLRRIDSEIQHLEHSLIRALIHANSTKTETSDLTTNSKASEKESSRPLLPEELLTQLNAKAIKPPPEILANFNGSGPGHQFFSLANSEGKILLQSDNAPSSLNFLPLPDSNKRNEISRTHGTYRESARSAPFGLCSIVGRDIAPERAEMQRYALSLAAIGLTLWGLGLLGGWWLAGKAIQPIQRISRTATRIAEGNLQERIDTNGGSSELDQLSEVLNHTFERLNSAFERQRQFTADASHELRTPLTIIISETQRMRKREHTRSTEEYQESFDLCHDAGKRMRHLVESLLLLARQDDGTPTKHHTTCQLSELARQSIAQHQPLAEAKSIQIQSDLKDSQLIADPNSLMIAINNLIGNAIHHQQENGTVKVSCGQHNDTVYLQVSDDGPGIPQDDLPHIFERFYRADKSRSGEETHSGLGLALVQTIAHNMKGQIEVQSKMNKGSCFTLHLPVEPSPK
ncbi:sensor histidine kinase [Rubritalea spongiae]|uniref:histidine kinase n=1 Tax=Rubritalea spongiae TaxID=430797 RepID=A0ABW5DYN6_9BACT